MAVDLIKNNPATTVAVGVATGIFVLVQSSEKPVAARIAELIRGARGAPKAPVVPLPRPATVPAGKIRLCMAGYQH